MSAVTTPPAIPPQRPGRAVTGMSAVLLPFEPDGAIAWDALAEGVERTVSAGLVPAVNMDTGYGPSLDAATRARVLALTAEVVAGREAVPGWRFVAGAHAVDADGPDLDLAGYRAAVDEVTAAGGVPMVFPPAGLGAVPDERLAAVHAEVAGDAPAILGFELGRQFHPHGRIWSLDAYRAVLDVPAVVGAKHSSLRRAPEWERLALRDERRPDFLVLTGNDLAIDMVRWGSDYLLGLSALAPGAFACRDRLWAARDPRALDLDDALQALGAVAFRDPVPAYRHDVALVWERRGWAPSARVLDGSPTRSVGEVEVLAPLLDRLDDVVGQVA
jgi:dihydrodipicolinate synthase/N-acetylneuraminate lyase